MIKVECNEGIISVSMNGTGLTIMSELCVIVDRVCQSMAEESVEDKHLLMVTVANAIKRKAKAGIYDDALNNN